MKREFEDAPGVRAFKLVLRRWRAAIGRYNRQMGDDCAWKLPRAGLHWVLAAAAWLSGGVASEEWRAGALRSLLRG